ncbi:MAG: von Willebrand factor type A domain-containing protein [Candidatus Krumholzibacteriota bacterium]|nr:von Willebrand factor type A domain-containing protein [Candidatus Krumholzibacteriota bacterium]
MKNASIWLALLAIVTVGSLVPLAGENGTVKGRVIADSSQAPLAYANVILVGTNLGALSDADGKFTINNVPPGTYTVKVMMMGFKSIEMGSVVVVSGAAVEVNFALHKTIVAKTQDIVVTADKPLVEVTGASAIQIDGVGVADRLGGGTVGVGTFGPGHRPPSEPWNTESYDRIYENEFLDVVANPVSTFSIDVDAASYSNMRRYINNGRIPPPDAVRIEELINYFHYDYPDPTGKDPFAIITEVAACPWNAQNRLVHIGLQGKRVSTKDLPPANIVFLLDVSGSMRPPNKLPLLKRSLRLLVENLREEDRVAIVVYAGAAGLVLPSTPGDQKEVILESLERLHAGGTTAGGAGIKLAYKVAQENFIKGGNNRVILATDGDFNTGVSSDAEMTRLIEEKRESGVFITVLGFGTGNLKDSKMEKIADKGNGNYAYIDNLYEAKKVLVSEMGGLFTIAKDVKLQIEFNPARVRSYRLVGYENRMLKREDFDDDTKDAGELGAGHSVTALYEIVPASGELSFEGDLKYMTVGLRPEALQNKEVLTVRFRYKQPDGDKSRLITQVLEDRGADLEMASNNFRFSAAVASFGMLLRDSKFKGESSWDDVVRMARAAKGTDTEGYRAEFIRVVEMCQLVEDQQALGPGNGDTGEEGRR